MNGSLFRGMAEKLASSFPHKENFRTWLNRQAITKYRPFFEKQIIPIFDVVNPKQRNIPGGGHIGIQSHNHLNLPLATWNRALGYISHIWEHDFQSKSPVLFLLQSPVVGSCWCVEALHTVFPLDHESWHCIMKGVSLLCTESVSLCLPLSLSRLFVFSELFSPLAIVMLFFSFWEVCRPPGTTGSYSG